MEVRMILELFESPHSQPRLRILVEQPEDDVSTLTTELRHVWYSGISLDINIAIQDLFEHLLLVF